MNCRFNRILVSRYLDGQTDTGESEKVRAHLGTCPQCNQEVTSWQSLSGVLKQMPPAQVSADYEVRFQKRLAEATAQEENEGYSVLEGIGTGIREGLDRISQILAPVPVLARVAAVTLVCIIGLGYFGGYFYRPGLPVIISTKGNVQTYQGKGWQEARMDSVFKEGEIIKTGKDSFIDIELKKGYKLRLKENSEILAGKLIRQGRNAGTQLVLNRGRLLVDIDAQFKRRGKEFKIDTFAGTAVAHGTEFLVDVDPRNKRMWLGVLEGAVGVSGRIKTETPMILVKAKEKTTVLPNAAPTPPIPLTAEELDILREIERIGKLLVSLVLSDTPNRVKELLSSPRFYAYGKEPQELQKILKEAIGLLNEAIRSNDRTKHMQVIERLEKAIQEYPAPEASPQLLVFVGAYYEWLSLHNKAVETFQKVLSQYSSSEVVSLAECAIGIIEEKTGNRRLAEESYRKVLSSYPASLEISEAQNGLERLTSSVR